MSDREDLVNQDWLRKTWIFEEYKELNDLYTVYFKIESIENALVLFFEGCECIYKKSKKKEKTKERIIKEFSYYKNQLECWETIARNSMRKINSNKEVDKEYKKESKRVFLGTKEYIAKVNKEMDDFEKKI